MIRFAVDGARRRRVLSTCLCGGEAIPETLDRHDFKRLEEAVAALVDKYQRSQAQVASLRRDLAECDRRIRGQEVQIRQLRERREDAVKRIDLLLAELDRLDSQLASRDA